MRTTVGNTLSPMESLIGDLQLVFTQTIANISSIAAKIVETPILLLGAAFLFTGVMFKYFKKILVNS